MVKTLKSKIYDSLLSIVPITFILMLISIFIVPISAPHFSAFLIGAFLRFLGMVFFTVGIEIGMMRIGSEIGAYITKKKKLMLVILLGFLIGFFVSIAEPDLRVLSSQVPSIQSVLLISVIALGVAFYLVIALLRIVFQIPYKSILLVGYGVVFLLFIVVPTELISLAFDAGGVTTGSMTVPFVMALGFGVAAMHSSATSEEDSFGLIGIASIGPILAVLLLGLVFQPSLQASESTIIQYDSLREMSATFVGLFRMHTIETLIAIVPILCIFFIMQWTVLKLPTKKVQKIIIGVLFSFIGLVLLLVGAYGGFLPIGFQLGEGLMKSQTVWLIIPIGMLFGCTIIVSEPAVHVLNHQVEEITSGTISKKAMLIGFAISISVSVGFALIRMILNISIIVFVLPMYAIAIGLSFLTPKRFTAIAFDSGGVASGPMTATFLLPFALGVASALQDGGTIVDGFGMVAFVAMMPLIVLQLMGVVYAYKTRPTKEIEDADEILDLQSGE